MNKIKVISVVGPTASGKTRLAAELAVRFGGEVVSADSMQIYKDMKIATAKPDEEEMRGVAHHLIDFLPLGESYSVARFKEDAAAAIEDIHSRGKLPVIAGGTGLYIDSLLKNVEFFGDTRDEKLTRSLFEICDEKGVDFLLETLREFDPESAQRMSAERNPKRIVRAIEFYKTTGITITEQNRRSLKNESPYSAVKLGITFHDRQKLYDRINLRVDLMLERGLLDEAREVLSKNLSGTAAVAIGCKELAPYINGEADLEQCVEKLKRETRRYAKRQLTWFRRDPEINWLFADGECGFEALIEEAVKISDKGLHNGQITI